MLTKAQNKYIRSLSQQKYRKEHRAYVVEGDKVAGEWLDSKADIKMVVALPEWIVANGNKLAKHPQAEIIRVEPHQLEAVSGLQTPNNVLLVVGMENKKLSLPAHEWCIAVENLQDPGNMGTIIRIADWFGIRHVVASPGSADFYNPKVIQAAMGGHLRVQLHEAELEGFLSAAKMPVLAAVLGGDNVYELKGLDKGVILIGNESKGLSQGLIDKATHKITIPRRGGAESLNAAVSAGILCALLIQG